MIQSGAYTPVDVGYPYILRGTNQQTETGALWLPPSYRSHGQGPVASATMRMPGVNLGYFALHNRSGSTIAMGIGVRIPNALWRAGQWTNATTTYADDTTDAQDAGADDFALETTTANDGYCILSRVPFNAVSINVGTASVKGTTVARAARFSSAAGTAWQTAEANIVQQTGSADDYAIGEAVVVFAPPVDWGKSSSLATDLPDGYYAMNMRATDAPDTTAGLATAIEIFRLYYVTENVSDNSTLLEEFSGRDFVMAVDPVEGVYGDALVAFFGTANDQNRATVQVRMA